MKLHFVLFVSGFFLFNVSIKFIHVFVCISIAVHSFLWLLIFHCMNIPCFKNPISNIWVVFYKADINHMFSFSLGAYSVEEELLSHRLEMFNFIRNCQTIFQNCFNILHSYWECMRVPVVLRHHYLTLSVFQFLLM